MAEIRSERRRSRTRPRTGEMVKYSSDNVIPPSSPPPMELGKGRNKIKTSLSSVGAVSHRTDSTEQSYTMSDECALSQSIPLEVVIINDDAENIPSIRGHVVKEDVDRKLKQYETLLVSYQQKLRSSENLNSSLHKYLRQTQGYAEDLLSDRQELLEFIKDVEQEDNRRIDQELLLKFIMCSGLFFYLFGGSHQFLVGTVVLQLMVTVVNIVF
jgi:hypothetical protein